MNILEQFKLNGKKALVTAGGSGIGRAYCHALAEAGADVAVVDIERENAKTVTEELKSIGCDATAVIADVSKEEDIDMMMGKIIDRWGRLDIAVNNVGISIWGNAENFALKEWDRVMDLDLRGAFICAQKQARVMIAQRYGKIIFTSSISARIVNIPQFQVSMSVAKAGLEHLTRCLAVEWIPYGINVNCISPGAVMTPALEKPYLKEKVSL